MVLIEGTRYEKRNLLRDSVQLLLMERLDQMRVILSADAQVCGVRCAFEFAWGFMLGKEKHKK